MQDSDAATVLIAIVVTLVAAKIIYGGVAKISKVSAVLVPAMGILFALATVTVLVTHFQEIPSALCEIFRGAFCETAVLGGCAGQTVLRAIRLGVSRGVFSNEAGLGSASIAAASAQCHHPAEQGLVTMTGTFLDTIVLCSLTGLAIIVTGAHHILPNGGAVLTALAYDRGIPFAGFGKSIVNLSLVLFAFASVLWRAVRGVFGRTETGISISSVFLCCFVLRRVLERGFGLEHCGLFQWFDGTSKSHCLARVASNRCARNQGL